MNTVLVATDGSRGANAAVREGLELAQQTGAAVTFVAVRPTPLPVLGDPFFQRALIEDSAALRGAVIEAVDEADRRGIPTDYEILEGDPAAEIVRLARLRDVDLVVVGSRGRGAVTAAVLGSVSRRVVHEAERPVLVVNERVAARADLVA
ncbi:MAG TPA: universal stress protein [Gaiellaceae bacterium]|jgi:nucleotide-binding universal stress UspA family protein|nr:universal stress protein [Gaiellaceae bacterium]